MQKHQSTNMQWCILLVVCCVTAAAVSVPALGLEVQSSMSFAAESSPDVVSAPPTSGGYGYLDMWTIGPEGCTQTASPVYFTPGLCFYVPFLSSFAAYFVPAKPDGYAIVYYSADNSTAFLYAYQDAQCQQSSNWSYSRPITTEECFNGDPNIWPAQTLGPAAPAWPANQLMAPSSTQYSGQTCIPVTANGFTLGQCYGAGTSSPMAVFCNGGGATVTFVQYAPGSNCEPLHAIGTRQLPTGCDIAAETIGYVCPAETGPTAPTLPGSFISLTWFDSVDSCSGPVISTVGFQQDVCVRGTMYHCDLNNGTYTEYSFNSMSCEQLVNSQVFNIGCNEAYTTIGQCAGPDVGDAALRALLDPNPNKSDASPQIAEY